jgi:hypothetical protein
MADEEPWTTLVIAPGETMNHGLNPQDPDSTLCGAVTGADVVLYRAPFYGGQQDDCPTCAALLPENHYPFR